MNATKMNDRRPNFDFFEMGIKAGEELVAVSDSTIKVQVKDERKVTYKNEDYFLTALDDELGFPGNTCEPWLYKGKSLDTIYEETYPKEEEKKEKIQLEEILEKYRYPTNYYRMQMKHSEGERVSEKMIDKKLITSSHEYGGDVYENLQKGDVILVHKGSYPLALVSVIEKQTELDELSFGIDYSVDVLKDYRINKTSYNNVPRSGTFSRLKDTSTEVYRFIEKEYLTFLGVKNMQQIIIEEKYIPLLKTNHNIILHGAPGTGKSYLAKDIAKAMGCTDNELEFVQFHPSYDYTDFVEGLRPVKNEDGSSIGFERKDGVFKEFCERAAKNLADSKKTESEIKKENRVNSIFESFLDYLEDKLQNGPINLYGKYNIIHYVKDSNGQTRIFFKSSMEQNTHAFFEEKILKDYPNYVNGIIKTHKDVPGGGEVVLHHAWSRQYFALFNLIKTFEENEYKQQNDLPTLYKHVQQKPFVFIIDEINRGEMSKIFGELFFSIDPGYRGVKGLVQTQYQNLVDDGEFVKGFYVPENVYIIGTMNDIDRSVESMDFAMRRRFIFKEITAEESGINMGISEEATRRMTNLNKAISSIEGLNSSYYIGGAYFLKEVAVDGEMKKVSVESEDFAELWELKLEPLLKEYLRGMEDAEEKLESLRTAYEKKDEESM